MYSAFLLGAFSLLTQIYALKELSGILTGHEASLGLGLSAWLLWTAAGMSLAFKIRIVRNNYGPDAFHAACLILTAAAALNLLLLRKAGLLMTPGLSPGLLQLILFSFLLPLPAAIANGAALALGLSARRLAFYRAEAAGAAGAGLLTLAHAVHFPWLDPLLLCGATAAALLLSSAAKTGPAAVRALPAAFVSLLFAGGLSIVPPFALPSSYKNASEYARTTGSTMACLVSGVQTTFIENGAILTQLPPAGTAEIPAQLALLAHKAPENVLLAGPGAVFLAREAAKNKARNVVIAEPDRYRHAFLIGRRGVDPGPARIERSDPRVLLRTVSAGYNLIIQTTPEPLNAASNRFFTVQFFREAAGALKKNGILVFSLPFSENYLPPERAYLSASVLASASSVFRHTELIPGGALTVLASDGPIDLSPETLARRYKARRLDSPYLAPENLPFILDPYRRQWALAATGRIKAPPLNTDLEPAAYFHLWKMWLAMFVSPGALTGLALLVIVLALLAGRLLRPGELLRDGRAAGIFLAGFWAMGVEIACLFLFQNFSGQLNWKMGVLFAGFMVGSAAGALLFAGKSPVRGRATVLSLAFLLTLGLWHYVPVLGELRASLLFPLFLGIIFCAGAAAGGYYAAAGGGEAPCVRLYYSELLGAALGGFVFSAVLIPLAGLRVSLLCGAAALAAAAPISFAKLPPPENP